MRGKRTKKRQRKPSQVSIRSGQVEFVKVGTDTWRWRDVYRWLLGLRWPQFAAFVASLYVGLNVFFAALYSLQQNSIAGSTGGHWVFITSFSACRRWPRLAMATCIRKRFTLTSSAPSKS